MLSIFADVRAGAVERPASGADALLPSRVQAWPVGTAAIMYPRPRACRAADAFGQRRLAAGHGAPLGQQSTAKQYLNMTRIAAASGGASGPHPARDPV